MYECDRRIASHASVATLDAAQPDTRLREALLRYGSHDPTCTTQYEPRWERPCNCGWDSVLATINPVKETS